MSIRIIKKFLAACLGLSIRQQGVNYFKTFIFNYIAFGLDGIIKLPVLIYGNTKIYKIGKIEITCPWRKGVVSIGRLDYKSQGITKFYNAGYIKIEGPLHIEGCTILENTGCIIFRGFNRIGDGTNLFIRNLLDFGEQSRLGFHSMVMDSDDHFTIDTETHKINRTHKPIIIGKYNFIGNSTFIKKGTKTPDYLIVASPNALLIKDYSNLPLYSVVGGSPVKLLKTGIRRIFNEQEESKLRKFFNEHPLETSTVVDVKNEDIDNYCKNTTEF